jgi:hypothetical protein
LTTDIGERNPALGNRHGRRDPEVIVIGGVQSRLMLAARLGQIGVDAADNDSRTLNRCAH